MYIACRVLSCYFYAYSIIYLIIYIYPCLCIYYRILLGIRCEKASSYMLSQGFDTVYHLKGGILKYLEDIPEEQSTWNGQCYVFDQRVSVGHGLVPGQYTLCRSCRHPLGVKDSEHEWYEEGVSCQYCYDKLTQAQKEASRERHLQMRLAEERHTRHLGHSTQGKHKRGAGHSAAMSRETLAGS